MRDEEREESAVRRACDEVDPFARRARRRRKLVARRIRRRLGRAALAGAVPFIRHQADTHSPPVYWAIRAPVVANSSSPATRREKWSKSI